MTVIGNKLKVLEFLQKEKYAAKNRRSVIKKSKLYGDFQQGLFACQDEDRITEQEVLQYIHRAGLVRLEGNAFHLDRLREEEIAARIGAYKAREAKANFELEKAQGKYMLKQAAITEMCLKWVAVQQIWKNMVDRNLYTWIEFVGGDHRKKDELQEMIFNAQDDEMDEMAKVGELRIVIPNPDKDEQRN